MRSQFGEWAVVTGASSGIGRAIARRLAAEGIALVLVARGAEALDAVASELRAAHGTDVVPLAIDLSRSGGAAELLAATSTLDVGLLVAAAGFCTSGPFIDSSLERELEMLAVNCRAVLELTHAFARRFAERKRGGIVLMSSIVAFQGTPWAAHYSATKAYNQALAEALHVELGPRGVTVLASAPGPTSSGFAVRAGMRMGRTVTSDDVARGTLAALGRKATVLPGVLSKVLTWSLAPLPRAARVRIMGAVMGGMTGQRPTSVSPPGVRGRG
ncbi:MAG TPA: SDR family oxidoreductase [Gemmatimonadaceae bacterium]|nr:SDR family oxidoreductase [Gemmatimonadaceae bacterium]